MRWIGAFTIFDDVGRRFCDVNFAEARLRNTVDLQAVAKIANWIVACQGVSLWLRLGGVLEDAKHDELSGPHRCDANLANQSAVEDVVLRHSGPVAGDMERFLFGRAHEGSQAPLGAKEELDGVNHTGPQAFIIGFENNPLSSFVNRAREKDEEPANADVFP